MTNESNKQLAKKLDAATPEAKKEKSPAVLQAEYVNKILLSRSKSYEEALAGTGMSPERFVRILITEITGNEKLMLASVQNPVGLLSACMEMAQLGLDPATPNEASLVPFGNEVTLIPGYKGLAKMAIQSANDAGFPLKNLSMNIIYEKDLYDREMGASPYLTHKPPPFGQDRGKVLGYYAVSSDVNGRINFEEMSVAEVKKHKDRFMKNKKGPLAQAENDDIYGLKTVLRKLIWRHLPMGAKLTHAMGLEPGMEDMSKKNQKLPPIDVTPEGDEPLKPLLPDMHSDGDPNEGGLIPGVEI